MRDIVATIQAEQDEIIRAPLDDLIVVQGGPGTGKTAVGQHRDAFLLYEHRDLFRRAPWLVVGPNPLFLAYISEALPSLGESSVVQTTVELLLRRYRFRHVDPSEVAALKGDGRMALVIAAAISSRIGREVLPLEAPTIFGIARLSSRTCRPRWTTSGGDAFRPTSGATCCGTSSSLPRVDHSARVPTIRLATSASSTTFAPASPSKPGSTGSGQTSARIPSSGVVGGSLRTRKRVGRRAVGGRTPILDVANRLLPVAAPNVRPAKSVRQQGRAPVIVAAATIDAAVQQSAALARRSTRASLALLAAEFLLDSLAAALNAQVIDFTDGRIAGADRGRHIAHQRAGIEGTRVRRCKHRGAITQHR